MKIGQYQETKVLDSDWQYRFVCFKDDMNGTELFPYGTVVKCVASFKRQHQSIFDFYKSNFGVKELICLTYPQKI